ncbi:MULTISPECIES: hypothetical protein [Streptomyces]|uniref:Deferrochelatase/peroxidase EfeB n=1 Tax=Streptomyces lonegramiae TaxID=3075524 RepID=A0ABU2XG43_9ACTN|nr:hypothetical protein [Streptomyces sp. DSM 41529]MDT0544797.1 hypothetical protein [Streptomyces sp. DSM 41529]
MSDVLPTASRFGRRDFLTAGLGIGGPEPKGEGVMRWGADEEVPKECHFPLDVSPGDERLATIARKFEQWDRAPDAEHGEDHLGSDEDSNLGPRQEQFARSSGSRARRAEPSSLLVANLRRAE